MTSTRLSIPRPTSGRLLDRLGPGRQPWLLRGDNAWAGKETMGEAERRGQPGSS